MQKVQKTGGRPPKKPKTAPTIVGLELTVGYNHSDATFGWKGYKNALTVYYLHESERYLSEEHSYPLVPGLTPQINIETVSTHLIGKPYTHCISDPNYSVTQCKYKVGVKTGRVKNQYLDSINPTERPFCLRLFIFAGVIPST